MTFLHRDKNSAARRTNFSASAQRALNGRAIVCDVDDSRGKKQRVARWSWPQHFDRIFGSHSAWRAILFRALHQMIRRGPVAMAIEQRADDAAIQDSTKRFVFFLRFPFGDQFAVVGETSNMQPIRICRAATEADIVGRVFFLK